jgi:hypothetical protein
MPDSVRATPLDTFEPDLDEATHRRLAARCFNHAWTLMELDDRDAEGDRVLLEVAHASRLHWRLVGGPVEMARAAWLISRVHAVLGDVSAAMAEALECLRIAEQAALGPFDRAFAFEAIARARTLDGDRQGAATARAAGEATAVEIETDADRDWVRRNLASLDVPPRG